jgi:hypothetical protein
MRGAVVHMSFALTARVQGPDQLLELLDFEQSALMLVLSPPGVRPSALRRLAVAEIELGGSLRGAV